MMKNKGIPWIGGQSDLKHKGSPNDPPCRLSDKKVVRSFAEMKMVFFAQAQLPPPVHFLPHSHAGSRITLSTVGAIIFGFTNASTNTFVAVSHNAKLTVMTIGILCTTPGTRAFFIHANLAGGEFRTVGIRIAF